MKKKAFLFPGQGAQNVGMGKKLCEEYKTAYEVFDEASEAINIDLKKLCFDGSSYDLTLSYNTQPAILTLSVAMFRVLMQSQEIIPDIMAGHSLGEISALTCAGAIDFKDAVKIVRKRGEFMQDAVEPELGAMAAVMTRNVDLIREICEKVSINGELASISNYNSRTQTVISGNRSAVENAMAELARQDIESRQLNVGAPFHCALMKPAAELFVKELENYRFHDLKYPVLSNVTAVPYSGKEDIVGNLTAQIVEPVQWVRCMDYSKKLMTEYAVEVGPGKVLKNMMKTNHVEVPVFACDVKADMKALEQFIQESYIPFLSRSLGIAVSTRNRGDNGEDYRKGVIEPYNHTFELQELIEKEERKATMDEMNQAIAMLKTMFKVKKTPVPEQINSFKTLFKDSGTEDLFKSFDYSGLV